MFLLLPAYKDYIWGGTRLTDAFHKRAPFSSVAESWELSTHPDGLTRIASGADAGQTLNEYLAAHPKAAPGIDADGFPILVKLIDAGAPLSVQVHPDDAYARAHENSRGKTELWHILDAAPGAYLYLGLNRAVTREELKSRILDGTVEDVLNRVPVRPGETYYVPAGVLHAIGAGVLLCEVQESSNLTYRVYDYGRRDAFGNARQLHIEQALAVAKLLPSDCTPPGAGEEIRQPGSTLATLVRCPYFSMQRLLLDTNEPYMLTDGQFLHLLCVDGEAEARQGSERLQMRKGDGLFLPACETAAISGRATILLITSGACV